MSRIADEELFKICLEFWHFFANNVMTKMRNQQNNFQAASIPGLNLPTPTPQAPTLMHAHVYPGILTEVK